MHQNASAWKSWVIEPRVQLSYQGIQHQCPESRLISVLYKDNLEFAKPPTIPMGPVICYIDHLHNDPPPEPLLSTYFFTLRLFC